MSDSRQQQIGAVYIPASIMCQKDLTLTQKIIWGRIQGLSTKEGYCYASNKWIGEQIGLSKSTISNNISMLVSRGYLKVILIRDEKKEIKERRIYPLSLPTGTPIPGESDTPIPGESKESVTDSSFREESKSMAVQAQKAAPSPLSPLDESADEVIDYLNKLAGTRYRHSKASRKFIRARIREGATLEDCKLIVEHKVSKWLFDPAMAEYLRPTTLFRPTHFEEYLAAAIRWHETGRPLTDEAKRQKARMRSKITIAEAERRGLRRTGPDGNPLPPQTSIKGVLSAMMGEG